MLEHTKLWGGGGNWQKSVDDWEKKEEGVCRFAIFMFKLAGVALRHDRLG